MESELFENRSQIELMLKLADFLSDLDEEDLNPILEKARDLLDSFTEEEKYYIAEEVRRLKKESDIIEKAEEHIRDSEELLNKVCKNSTFIPGLETADVYI